MDGAVEKSISFLLFIAIGLLLRKKIPAGSETKGIKSLILSIALPVTIFLALLKINIDFQLILFPVMAIGFNIVLFFVAPFMLKAVNISQDSDKGKSGRLLLSSLAPGLSCFPFILEFLGDASLAKAAMADLGNKVYVLFILYLVALNWYFKNQQGQLQSSSLKIKSVLKSLIYEPVNLFILSALILVSFGIRIDNMPSFLSMTLTKLSYLMTPLVLIFIGLAVKFGKQQFFQILSLLLIRASFTLLLITAVIYITDLRTENNILVMISFALSACSFWPFAHISLVNQKEMDSNVEKKTFSTNFALAILALSLPISVLLILGILTAGKTFTSITNILTLGVTLGMIGAIYPFYFWIKKFILHKNRRKIAIEERPIGLMVKE
jgi:predicted permease